MTITPIKGLVYPRLFLRGTFESRNIKPVKRIFKIGYNFQLYWVVRPKYDKGTVYKEKCLEMLKKYVDLKTEKVDGGNDWSMTSCYSKQDGSYIGEPDDAWAYLFNLGIETFYKAEPNDKVASIGFNPVEEKWYGWSHRALYGFGIGHITEEGNCETTSGYIEEYIKEHPEELDKLIPAGFKCETLNDCKKVAIAFANSVG